jgi:uncharacterized membrane protein YvbJ
MAYCKNCGVALEENAKFCATCGASQEETVAAEITTEEITAEEIVAPAPKKASGNLNIAQLVWSIINLIACCGPLGIAGLVLTIIAKDAPSAEDEAKKLKAAKTCNLIGTIGGAVITVLYTVIVVFAMIAELA